MGENQHGIYKETTDGWIQELINKKDIYQLKQCPFLFYFLTLIKNIMS